MVSTGAHGHYLRKTALTLSSYLKTDRQLHGAYLGATVRTIRWSPGAAHHQLFTQARSSALRRSEALSRREAEERPPCCACSKPGRAQGGGMHLGCVGLLVMQRT